MSKSEAWAASIDLLRDVEIADPERRAHAYAVDVSGGMAQRMMIACALAGDPEVLIADEPTTALDVTVQAQILQLMIRLCKERDMAMLLITHDLGVVATVSDRVAVMYSGQLVEQGNLVDVYGDPQHPYTNALIRCSLLQGDDGDLYTIPQAIEAPPDVGCRFAERCPVHDSAGVTDHCHSATPALKESAAGHWTRCYAPGYPITIKEPATS